MALVMDLKDVNLSPLVGQGAESCHKFTVTTMTVSIRRNGLIIEIGLLMRVRKAVLTF